MIVRILNERLDMDRFFDCRDTCIGKMDKEGEFFIMFEFDSGESIEIALTAGDAIYYMNDSGSTVHSDCRMCK